MLNPDRNIGQKKEVMKKKKLTEIAQTTDVRSIGSLIGMGAAGVVSTPNPISDVYMNAAPVDDVNVVHSSRRRGLSILSINSATQGVPISSSGILFHVQRQNGNDLSATQVIFQAVIYGSALYIREGRGNGDSITFRPFRSI